MRSPSCALAGRRATRRRRRAFCCSAAVRGGRLPFSRWRSRSRGREQFGSATRWRRGATRWRLRAPSAVKTISQLRGLRIGGGRARFRTRTPPRRSAPAPRPRGRACAGRYRATWRSPRRPARRPPRRRAVSAAASFAPAPAAGRIVSSLQPKDVEPSPAAHSSRNAVMRAAGSARDDHDAARLLQRTDAHRARCPASTTGFSTPPAGAHDLQRQSR